jgi:hypothetical protein
LSASAPFRALAAAFLVAGCAAAPTPPEGRESARVDEGDTLARLPATYSTPPVCPGCRSVTLTLRPDGAYLVREVFANSEFYDFGRWERGADGVLVLRGGREAPGRYVVRAGGVLDSQGAMHGDLQRQPQVASLRGPFRMVGLYDGRNFKECRTGVLWRVAMSRAADDLRKQLADKELKTAFVSIDARFEQQSEGEVVVLQRQPSVLNERRCPG